MIRGFVRATKAATLLRAGAPARAGRAAAPGRGSTVVTASLGAAGTAVRRWATRPTVTPGPVRGGARARGTPGVSEGDRACGRRAGSSRGDRLGITGSGRSWAALGGGADAGVAARFSPGPAS